MRLLRVGMAFVLVGSLSLFAQSTGKSLPNPQPLMVGARILSLGGANPVIEGDINAILMNPASVRALDAMPLSISSQKVLGAFEYKLINTSFQTDVPVMIQDKSKQNVTFGLAYASVSLDNIPETIKELNSDGTNGPIRGINTYSSGVDILYGAVGTQFYEVFGFNTLTSGIGIKLFRQTIKSDVRSAVGVDLGTVATYILNYAFVDRVQMGMSMHNLISTPLVWDTAEKDEAFLPIQAFMGVRADLFDDTLSVFGSTGYDGFSIGSEYLLSKNLFLRGATNLKSVQMGTGIAFENIAGVGDQGYTLRLDMGYSYNAFPFNQDPNVAMSMTILGESRPRTPQILNPMKETTTREKLIRLTGIGPRNTTIQIYNNRALSRTTMSDRYGNVVFDKFPLSEGKNLIHLRAYSVDQDNSIDSDSLLIKSDSQVPKLQLKIYPDSKDLVFHVESNEELGEMSGNYEEKKINFEKKTSTMFGTDESHIWEAKIPISSEIAEGARFPSKMKSLKYYATDKVGNKTVEKTVPFFVSVEFPKDKFVHYKEEIRILGVSSAMVKAMEVNNNGIYVDPNQNFSVSTQLKAGKNLLRLKMKMQNDESLTYTTRVLRLVTFPDLDKKVKERREIEFLATLGVLDGDADGNFYPNREVTRRYIARMMVKVNKLTVDKVADDLFSDVPKTDVDAGAISTAIQNGLMYPFPDGTFKPDQPLTMTEALFLLSNSGIVDESAAPANAEENQYIRRRELAQYLAYTPRYEQQIERLIDWEKGYQ